MVSGYLDWNLDNGLSNEPLYCRYTSILHSSKPQDSHESINIQCTLLDTSKLQHFCSLFTRRHRNSLRGAIVGHGEGENAKLSSHVPQRVALFLAHISQRRNPRSLCRNGAGSDGEHCGEFNSLRCLRRLSKGALFWSGNMHAVNLLQTFLPPPPNQAVAYATGEKNPETMSPLKNATSGFLAAFFSSLALCPTELVKCRLQALREMYELGKSDVNPKSM